MNTTSGSSKQAHRPAPSFLKVLILPDFNRLIRVPHFFSRNYEHSLCGGKVTLRIGAKTWDVKAEKTEDERYEFSGGWDKFAEDVGLRFGELVVCRLVGKSIFDVSIYGTTCCQRETKSESELKEKNISFSAILTNYHKFYLHIPLGFAKETEIVGKMTINLKNEEDEEWRVEVHRRRDDGRICITGEGWKDYWGANKLCVGTQLTFWWRGGDRDTLVVTKNEVVTGRESKRPRKHV